MKMELGNARETPRGAKSYFFLGGKKNVGKMSKEDGGTKKQ